MRPHTANQFRPTLESLDERIQPSWLGAPPAVVDLHSAADYHFTVTNNITGAGLNQANTFLNHEVDYRTFVAPRTGSYTFTAGANGSSVDTVAAVFNAGGQRLAYNDDSNGTLDSRFTATLYAGQTYVFGVTTYGSNTSPVTTGGYYARFTLPLAGASASVPSGQTNAYVSLVGYSMQIQMYGRSVGVFASDTHRVEVRLMDYNNQPIHTGSWVRSFNTAGDLIPTAPHSAVRTWDIDLTGFAVGRVAWIELRVSRN